MYVIRNCECVSIFGQWMNLEFKANRVSFDGRSVVALLDKDLDKGQVNGNKVTNKCMLDLLFFVLVNSVFYFLNQVTERRTTRRDSSGKEEVIYKWDVSTVVCCLGHYRQWLIQLIKTSRFS